VPADPLFRRGISEVHGRLRGRVFSPRRRHAAGTTMSTGPATRSEHPVEASSHTVGPVTSTMTPGWRHCHRRITPETGRPVWRVGSGLKASTSSSLGHSSRHPAPTRISGTRRLRSSVGPYGPGDKETWIARPPGRQDPSNVAGIEPADHSSQSVSLHGDCADRLPPCLRGRGTPRAGRKLALPNAFRSGLRSWSWRGPAESRDGG
jgi:hypothetical protein